MKIQFSKDCNSKGIQCTQSSVKGAVLKIKMDTDRNCFSDFSHIKLIHCQ